MKTPHHKSPSLLVLAAGMGSRYGQLKQIDVVNSSENSLLDYALYDALKAGFKKITFVIRKSFGKSFIEKYDQKLKHLVEVNYVFQEIDLLPPPFKPNLLRQKPWGTGHAIWTAKEIINEPFLVINADDYYGSSSYKLMFDYLKHYLSFNLKEFALMAFPVEKTLSENGAVSRGICKINDDNFLLTVEEKTAIKLENNQIISSHNSVKEVIPKNTLVSMNMWGLTPFYFKWAAPCFKLFLKANFNSLDKEYFLPKTIDQIIKSHDVKIKVLSSGESWFGLTFPEDKILAKSNLEEMTRKGLYPKNLFNL